MFNDLIKYIVGTATIIGLLSLLYRKKGHIEGPVAVGRVIRLFSGIIGGTFLVIALCIATFIILGKDTQGDGEWFLRLIILFFTFILGILFLIVAAFKKYSVRFSEELVVYSRMEKNSDFKEGKIEKIEIVLWMVSVICGVVALKTYSLAFFTLFFVFGFTIVILKIKKRKW